MDSIIALPFLSRLFGGNGNLQRGFNFSKVGKVATTCVLFDHRYEGDMLEEQFHGQGVANMQGGHKYEVRLTQYTSTVLHLYMMHNDTF